MMRSISLLSIALLLVAPGCSSEESTDPAATASSESAAAAPSATPEAANLDRVQQAIQQKKYVEAADILSQTQPAVQNFSDDERAKYRQQLMDTTQALLEAGDDPQARAAYEKLGRAVLGR